MDESYDVVVIGGGAAGLSGAVPLVVMLHGGYGNGVQAEDSYHWDPEADAGHFLLALPDGLNASWNGGGGCCGKSARQDVDDVAFLTQMVTMLRGEISIDPHRVYIAGVSNGGVMAYRMACQTDIFAAVGADCVVTDTWVSMGQHNEAPRRKQLLGPFAVDERLMQKAAHGAIFMHCLPAYRGHEVSSGVIDGPNSVVWDEAENRLHAQKAILAWCLGVD